MMIWSILTFDYKRGKLCAQFSSWHPDPPLPPLSDSQQLTDQFGVRRKDQLDSTLLQDGQGVVGPGRAGKHQGQALRADLTIAVY